MRHHFHAEQWLPHSIELVFKFFANPENLPHLMPPWQKARIDEASFVAPPPLPTSVTSEILAGAGTRMTLTFRALPLLPIRIAWDAKITEFTWNDHFCDSQLRGPFAYWHHCHRLKPETRDGMPGTLVRDEIEYEMHLGLLGELAQRLFAEWQLHKMFDYRHERTAELLASPCSKSSVPLPRAVRVRG